MSTINVNTLQTAAGTSPVLVSEIAKATDLAAPTGASLVGYMPAGAGAVATTQESVNKRTIHIKDKGALCDGITDDTINIQKALDELSDGQELIFLGTPLISGTLYCSNKNNVKLNFDACELKVSHSGGCSLLVHGGTLTRVTATWQTEMLEQAYEAVTTCVGVVVSNFKARSTATRKATQMIAYFADDLTIDAKISGSNGNGVELRHCARTKFGTFEFNDFGNYGLFVYQSHGLQGDVLKCSNGGRALAIKQRHKLYPSAGHHIKRGIFTNLQGFEDTAWATGGDGFNDLVALGLSAAAQTNRNFAGHEVVRHVTFDRVDLVVTSGAAVGVTNPAFHVGAFADQWQVKEINFCNGAKDRSATPLIIGARGDIARGKADGGTFGDGHVIGAVSFNDYAFTGSGALIVYGVSCTVTGGSYKNVNVAKLVEQEASANLPRASIDYLEFRQHVGAVTVPLGGTDRGVNIAAETLKFITGGNQLSFTPVNRDANTLCAPWTVRSAQYITVGSDELTVVSGGAGASNHASTNGVTLSGPTSGNLKCRVSVTAPTSVQAVTISSVATKSLLLEPCVIEVTGAPTGSKTALSISGEVTNMGGHTYTGTFGTTLSDTTGGKNAQNLRRVVYLTAPPSTSAWSTGDRTINIAPAVGQPKSWACTTGGTPGTWVSEGNL